MNIRNFVVISHIDHGKSTLADRMLELTGTVEPRKMREQFLDQMELERERGITIKLQPVRMIYHPDRGLSQTDTRTRAESGLLYEDLTYKIRGAIFAVKRNLGLGHKEGIYQKALAEEFEKIGLSYESEKIINVFYNQKKVGIYRPDFVVENKVLIELKALPFVGKQIEKQIWNYLKGSNYKLSLLVNFGGKDIDIKRIIYDTARENGLRESALSQRKSAQVEYTLNLIDTPGHIDFSYEVSRSLRAVEGAVLLVDATQGVEAQTFSNLAMAKDLDLKIIPAINKIDLPLARIEETKKEIVQLLDCQPEEILEVSAKTGQGVPELLKAIVERIPPPEIRFLPPAPHEIGSHRAQALIFDFSYSSHRGIIAYVRVFDGEIKKGEELLLINADKKFKTQEVGVFKPELLPSGKLSAGEIGYVVSGIKSPGLVRVGDTIIKIFNFQFSIPKLKSLALRGYKEPKAMIWASIYPESQDHFDALKNAFETLRLSDSAFSFEEESLPALGRGFKCGFLGMLHLEIVSERIRREFGINIIVASPSVSYRLVLKSGKEEIVYSAASFPEEQEVKQVFEQWVKLEILTPPEKIGSIIKLLQEYQGEAAETEKFGDERILFKAEMPLRELMRGFFDALKNVSSGYASLNYEIKDERPAEVAKLEILVAEEVVPAFSKIVPRFRLERLAEEMVERLRAALPKQVFAVKIQAKAQGRIIASRTLSALSKNVTGHLYGGDRTRKMKLWQKQKKGKKRLKSYGSVDIPQEVFLKMIQK